MKNLIYLMIITFLTSCDNSTDLNETEINTIDFENISELQVSITAPKKDRDYTYHNQGKTGVFNNPEFEIDFEGKVDLNLFDNSKTINPSDIIVKWSSNIDGVLFKGSLSNEYKSNFSKSLTKNIHKIYFEVLTESNSNFILKDSIVISNEISLQLKPTDKSMKIQWSKYEGDNFQSYLIYREDFTPIIEIFDIDKVEYEDTTITLTEVKKFQIIVKTSNNLDEISGSNIEEAEAGEYIKIPHFIIKVINDKSRNIQYAIVGEDSYFSNNASEYGLIIFDNNSDKLEIKDHILKEFRYSDLDMSLDGKYLFLCQRGVDKITRLDLESFETERFDVAYGGWGVHKIEVGDNYRLYCHRRPPTSGSSPMYILNGLTGAQVGYYNWLNHGDIEYNYVNNKLYHSTSVTSQKELIKFNIDNDVVNREFVFAPNIPFPKPFLLISDNGEQIFWEKFQLNKELIVDREFENPIVACNSESSYITDGYKLMDFNSLDTVFNYPNFPHNEYSSEIFINDNALLLAKSNQPYTNQRYTYLFKIKID